MRTCVRATVIIAFGNLISAGNEKASDEGQRVRGVHGC